ncbi:hypothetical protein PMAYCL1PPCAC_14987, partial [Pristionchus mayeri]
MDGIDEYHWNMARSIVFVISLVCLIGQVANFMIALTTFKTKTLRSTCNILIAVGAIGDIFHQLGGFLSPLPMLFNVHLEISRLLCIVIMFLPEMGITVGCVCILLIGVDRMISVLFFAQYKT